MEHLDTLHVVAACMREASVLYVAITTTYVAITTTASITSSSTTTASMWPVCGHYYDGQYHMASIWLLLLWPLLYLLARASPNVEGALTLTLTLNLT